MAAGGGGSVPVSLPVLPASVTLRFIIRGLARLVS